MLGLSYRQAKRVWARYRAGGAKALQHRHCGERSNRAYEKDFRIAVLKRVGERYADFGPTLAAEHLASDDDLVVNRQTLSRWMVEVGGMGSGSGALTSSEGSARRILATWCRWTAASTIGWKTAEDAVA